MDALAQLTQRFTQERELLELENRLRVLPEVISQAKFQLRGRQVALLSYEGSFRGLLDKFSGKREEKAEALRREAAHEEQALQQLLRQRDSLEQQRRELTARLEVLPSVDDLRPQVEETQWAALETGYCAQALQPLLEENRRALQEYRELIRGQRMEILSAEEQQQICTAPNIWGERCRPIVARLAAALDILGQPLNAGEYFEKPTAYLVNVAAKHNRIERAGRALDQVEALQRTVTRLLEADLRRD